MTGQLFKLLYLVAYFAAISAKTKPITIHVTSMKAQNCPDVQISNSSRKMEVVEDYTLARRTESGKSSRPGVLVYQGEDSKGDNKLTFPACYHVRFAVRVLKQLDDPEVEVMVQSLNLDMKLDCRQYNLQDLVAGCHLTPSDPSNCFVDYLANFSRVCDICKQLTRVDEEVAQKNNVKISQTCRNKCCKEPSTTPYIFAIKNLCISDKQLESAASEAKLSQYKSLLENIGSSAKDTLRFRVQIRDKWVPSGTKATKSESLKKASTPIGCFEVLVNYELQD